MPQLPGKYYLSDLPDPALPTIAARLWKNLLPSVIAGASSSGGAVKSASSLVGFHVAAFRDI